MKDTYFIIAIMHAIVVIPLLYYPRALYVIIYCYWSIKSHFKYHLTPNITK